MIRYDEYFIPSDAGRPYAESREHLEDALRFLDMLIDAAVEVRAGIPDRQALRNRGLVVTHEELLSYLQSPPVTRHLVAPDLGLITETDAALSHIGQRESLTAAAGGPRLFLKELCGALSLNLFDRICLLLAVASWENRRYERLFAALQDDITAKLPTIGLAEALIARIEPMTFSELLTAADPGRFAMAWLYRGMDEQAHKPVCQRTLEANPSTISWITFGDEPLALPERLDGILKKVTPNASVSTPEIEALASHLTANVREDIPEVIRVSAATEARITEYLGSVSHLTGRRMYLVPIMELLSEPDSDRRLLISGIRRLIPDAILVLSGLAALTEDKRQASADLVRELTRRLRILFIAEPDRIETWQKPDCAALTSFAVHLSPVRINDRKALWLRETDGLTLAEDIDLSTLAIQYDLSPAQIHSVATSAALGADLAGDGQVTRKILTSAIAEQSRLSFGHLATRLEPSYNWEDLEIPDRNRRILKVACNRFRYRNELNESWHLNRRSAYGNGVSILLYGPPGTGKTMASHVIANELGLELYRIDLSQISSKYIGETEKNLAAIFDEAAKSQVILFFDEADSLFGKRTEVSSSNDKYANAETAYLLQKIEEYSGISILATNLFQNFDQAFMRRITYAVHFDSPDEATRLKLFQSVLPPEVPVSKLIDFSFFAKKFPLSGSNIKAIMYTAAYLTASDGLKEIGPRQVVLAMQYEFRKLGLMLYQADFENYAAYYTP